MKRLCIAIALFASLDLSGLVPAFARNLPNESYGDYYVVDEGGKCGYIDSVGEYIIPARFDRASGFARGLAPVTVGYDTHFIDPSGKIVFSLPDRMRSFGFGDDDLAIVESRTGKGFIDRSGKLLFPPIYWEVRPFVGELWEDKPYPDQSITVVKLFSEQFAVIDRAGRILFGPRRGVISVLPDGVFRAWNPELQKEMYFDRSFQPLPGYSETRHANPDIDERTAVDIGYFHRSGYATAQKPGKSINAEESRGIIDKNGNWVVQPIYAQIFFNEGLRELSFIHARRGSKWGFIDISGKEVIPFQFDDILPFGVQYAPAKTKGRWGLIDINGQWKLLPAYDAVQPLSESAVAVQADGLWGVVNYDGHWKIKPRFRTIGYCQGRDYSMAEHLFEDEASPATRTYEKMLGGLIRDMDQKEREKAKTPPR